MPVKNLEADHRSALVAEILSRVHDINQAIRRLKHPLMHLVVELEPGRHYRQINLIIGGEVHHHLLHAASAGDAVDEIQIARRPGADGELRPQGLALRPDGGVIKPVGTGKMRAVQPVQRLNAGKGLMHRLQVLAAFELCIDVMLAPIAFDAAVGECPQRRSLVVGRHIAKVFAQHDQQLFHVRQSEVFHEGMVHFRRAFMLDGDPVIAGAGEATEDAFARGHGLGQWMVDSG